MIVIIHTFTGYYGFSDVVNIYLNTETHEISALKSNGGTPQITYDSFMPSLAVGDQIYSYANGDLTTVTFYDFYPFAKTTASPTIPPSPTIIVALVSKTDQTLVNTADGAITVSATGATNIEYSINNVDFQNSGTFTGLLPGNYIVFARDKDNVLDYNSISVTILPAPIPPDPPAPQPTKDAIANSDAEIEIQNAYKRVKVISLFGNAPSVIANGDFEVYDGQNWEYWVKYGGISVSRAQRTVSNSSGVQVPIENYSLKFNQRAVDTRYIQHSDIAVQSGDNLKVSYRVGKTPQTGTSRGFYQFGNYSIPSTYRTFYISKIRIRNGNKYLYNDGYGSKYEWVNQVATVSHVIDNANGDLSNYIINFSIPDIPTTGSLVIQFFGFQKVQTITTDPYTILGSIKIDPKFISTDLSAYDPIEIDDFTGSKSSQNGDNDLNGTLSISDNLRSFSESPDTFELLFGDYYYRQDKTEPLDNLYAIKYNGYYTEGWREFTGGSSNPVAFGAGLAKSILTAYQKPFRKWSGELTLIDGKRAFGYLDIFSFLVKTGAAFRRKQFMIAGCDIDLKTNQLENATLVEIFDKAVKSADNTIPSYPDMPDPVFVQDPNAVQNNGIFTSEFTTEFN